MAILEDNIKRINTKLQQLLKQFQSAQKENERLQRENNELRGSKEDHLQRIEQLQQQVNILKLAAGKMAEPDKKAFEKQVNRYIKEIDKCINLLSE